MNAWNYCYSEHSQRKTLTVQLFFDRSQNFLYKNTWSHHARPTIEYLYKYVIFSLKACMFDHCPSKSVWRHLRPAMIMFVLELYWCSLFLAKHFESALISATSTCKQEADIRVSPSFVNGKPCRVPFLSLCIVQIEKMYHILINCRWSSFRYNACILEYISKCKYKKII